MSVAAYYFDGKTSRRYAVDLSVESDVAHVSGEVRLACPLVELRVSERSAHTVRKVTFPDGAYLEIQDRAAFNALLAETGYRDSFVVRMQQSWRSTLLALLGTVAVLVLGYMYGLPQASKAIAYALPESVEHSIGSGTLAFLDKHVLAPSSLPLERREAIKARFQGLMPPFPNEPHFELVFRKGNIGPNAFALPSGQIVLTDEIVKLVDDDDAAMGILAHEMGHLYYRHLMRRIVQTSTVGAVTTLLFGDVSAVVANLPTLVLDMKYSRDAEREADDYAIAMLKKNGINLAKFALVFEKLGEKTGDPVPYLSSHPASAERIARIKDTQ
jgi:Zn-dependent protease with chaperone function